MSSIGHIAVTTKDMDASMDFYTKAMGFKKAFEINNPKTGEPWIIYLHVGKGQFLELFYNGTIENPWNGKLTGLNHICIQVDDIFSSTKRIEEAGYAMDSQPTQGTDLNWQSWVKDPDGVRIELMQLDEASPQIKYLKENSNEA
ncbi:MAG: VOC family protein [Clostridiales bacterium]|jgi:lactoylglutathione lyase|nr:VOC family protein [Clostridiales bacterium]